MKQDVLSLIFETQIAMAFEVWTSLQQQLLHIIVEKEGHLKYMMMTLKRGSRSLDEYLRDFKSICDNLVAIKEPVFDLDKVFQFSRGLGPRDENFLVATLSKAFYPTFSEFVLALQGHEQSFSSQKEEEKLFIEHA